MLSFAPAMALFTKDTPPARSQTRGEAPHGSPQASAFIGPNLTVEGTITGSDALTIEGVVRGNVNLTSDVRVGTKARVEATVHGKNVVVEGKLTGDISADERVELVASAVVDGNLKAPKIVVAEGAKFRGSVDMGSPRPKESNPASS